MTTPCCTSCVSVRELFHCTPTVHRYSGGHRCDHRHRGRAILHIWRRSALLLCAKERCSRRRRRAIEPNEHRFDSQSLGTHEQPTHVVPRCRMISRALSVMFHEESFPILCYAFYFGSPTFCAYYSTRLSPLLVRRRHSILQLTRRSMNPARTIARA